MGIFNAAIEINAPDNVSKVKFNIDLSGYVTKNNMEVKERYSEHSS